MNSWKHDTWWVAVSFTFVCGISLGGFICSLWETEQPARQTPTAYIQTIYEPAPCYDYTSEMHELAILREAVAREQEIREAKDYFMLLDGGIIYPSPVAYFEGKRSEPGKLAPETINSLFYEFDEIQAAKEWFERDRRDPTERVK